MLDRTTPPTVSLPEELLLPTEVRHECANGVPLYSLYAPGAEVVRLTLVFAGGSSVQSVPYSASSMLSMLAEGCEAYSSAQIAERFDFYGIFYDTSTDRDFSTITVAALRKFLPEALDLLQNMILKPLFDDRELSVHIAKKREGLIADREKPSCIAREAFAVELFGENHPYGRFFPTDDMLKITTSDLRAYHSGFLVAQKLFAVCSGAVGEKEIASIDRFLSLIPAGDQLVDRPIATPNSGGEVRRNVTRPTSEKAVQSCIRMGKILFTKDHPHYVPMQLLLTVLGGYFSSRLVRNLREDKGYTYGIYSSMVAMNRCGYMAIATDVALDVTEAALAEINREIEILRTELIDEDELQMAKNTITGELMRLLDGPFGIADIAIENISSSLPADYVNEFLDIITRTTPKELRELAVEYLHSFTTVVVN